MTIRWEDPPETNRAGRPGAHVEFFDTLRANRGRWARWPVKLSPKSVSVASAIRTGKYAGAKKGEFDARQQRTDDEMKVWVRYVGPPVAAAKPTPSAEKVRDGKSRPAGAPVPGVTDAGPNIPDGWKKRGAA